MATLSFLAKGIALGAAAMYLFDPVAGRRRRSLLRDQYHSALRNIEEFVDRGFRDLNNRLYGIGAKTRATLSQDVASDETIAQRVRSTMGRFVSHPGAIDVSVDQGRVVLSGPILADEVQPFVSAVSSVRGVEKVENQLEVHQDADISSLQGGVDRVGQRPDLLPEQWSPSTCLLATAAGLALMANCLVRQTPWAIISGALGFGFFLRGVTNQSLGQLFGSAQLQPRLRPRQPAPQQTHSTEGAQAALTESNPS